MSLPTNINFASLTNLNSNSSTTGQQQQQQQNNSNQNGQSSANSSFHEQHEYKLNTSNNQPRNTIGATPIKTLLEDDDNKSDTSLDDQGPTIANMPDRKF